MAQSNSIFTQTLSTSNVPVSGLFNRFVISAEVGIRGLALRWVSGTVTFKGGLSINGLGSAFITLNEGEPFSASSEISLGEITVDVTSGSCEIAVIK